MDAIKKQMLSMKSDKDSALENAEMLEQQLRDIEEQKAKVEEDLHALQKKFSNLEVEFDNVNEQHQEVNAKLETSTKKVTEMEQEVSSTSSRATTLEEDLERCEEKLQTATIKLDEASKAQDETERSRKVLENKNIADDERIDQLENQLKDAQHIAEEAESKYDETARKLALTDSDLERAVTRFEAAETKTIELDEELKVVGNNMKSLQISEQEACQREGTFEETIADLTQRLKESEHRAAEAEMTVSKHQKDIDRLDDELLTEKEKNKAIHDELDQTFAELAGY
ncbi:tropomyosin-like [Haliotis cracherodii]|uniref:tropomyosin-like n=1 Tax=Haliotis cracherodii TaxID=6455 RepID=UPI0039E9489A